MPRPRAELPPPLPPETRPVGQLIAETLRFYGAHFWQSIVLGLAPAVIDTLVLPEVSTRNQITVTFTVLPVVLAAAYVRAAWLVSGRRPARGPASVAFLLGLVLFVPFPLLANLYLIPAAIWLALFSLAVPVAVIEGLRPYASLRRSLSLAFDDFVHALGSASALFILLFLTNILLRIALRSGGEISVRAAAFAADLVLVPVLFLGLSMLYFDQAARSRAARTAPVSSEPG